MPYTEGDALWIPRPEAGIHYRWISADIRRLAQWQISIGEGRPGYALTKGDTVTETRTKAKSLGLNDTYVNELANRIQFGDLILAQIPQEEYERRVSILHGRQKAVVKSSQEIVDTLDLPGVKLHVREVGEIEDRKKFAQRESTNRVGYTGPA